jgi:IS30 family transposase
VAAEHNDRPRKTLGWASPAQRLEAFLREDTTQADDTR